MSLAVDVETGEAMFRDESGELVEGFASPEEEQIYDELVEEGTLPAPDEDEPPHHPGAGGHPPPGSEPPSSAP